MKETLIALDNYTINAEPYENEIDDYINTLSKQRKEESIESLNHKLREATRLGDVELQKYYLEQIVNRNKSRNN